MGTISAIVCLIFGIYEFYELSHKKDTLSKSEKYFRIGWSIFLVTIGCALIVKIFFS